jgi:hypothetical protein
MATRAAKYVATIATAERAHGDGEHQPAGHPDVGDVALDHALVDDVGVQVGKVAVGDRLGDQEDITSAT